MDGKNYRAWKSLADLTYYVKRDTQKADQLYRRALLINPNDGWLHAEYARLLLDQGLNDRAKQEAQLAKKLGYNDRNNEIWGRVGIWP
jgi:Tfp pilus assembly protein PilF